MTIAAVHVKLSPPQGSALSGPKYSANPLHSVKVGPLHVT